MPCLLDKDQPLRIQLSKNGVIHAGDYHTFGGYWQGKMGRESVRVPKRKGVRIACSWNELSADKIVSKKNKITCKNCMKKIGMDETPLSPQRFVVRRIDTGEFLKNTGTRCSGWAESITDAFFFKREHTAKDKCTVGRYRAGDKLLTYAELSKINKEDRAAGRQIAPYKHERIPDPNLEIRPVKITME